MRVGHSAAVDGYVHARCAGAEPRRAAASRAQPMRLEGRRTQAGARHPHCRHTPSTAEPRGGDLCHIPSPMRAILLRARGCLCVCRRDDAVAHELGGVPSNSVVQYGAESWCLPLLQSYHSIHVFTTAHSCV